MEATTNRTHTTADGRTVVLLTAKEFGALHANFKTGSARFGTAKVLLPSDMGTSLAPVAVVWSNGTVVEPVARVA